MRKVLRGYAKDKNGNLILIGAMPIPFGKDKAQRSSRRKRFINPTPEAVDRCPLYPRKRTFAPDVGDVCFCAKSGLMHRSISICVLVTNPHTTCRAARVLKRSADNLGNPYRCP
jgi:hypothetical protein